MKSNHVQDDNSIDVISPSLINDYSLFFGPVGAKIEIGEKVVFGDFQDLAELLVFLGLAQSRSWCRKNGWDKPLEPGYQEIVFGKLKYRICILR